MEKPFRLPIIKTKLFIGRPDLKLVYRGRLIDRLNQIHRQVNRGSLALISAPAGSGKSSLVAQWRSQCDFPVAALSLDEGDSDLTGFLTYLMAALEPVLPEIGKEAEEISKTLQPARRLQPPQIEAILTALLNRISGIQGPVALVLDDYHLVDSEPIDRALAFLLSHIPSNLGLVISTREDPNLPLAKLRAGGGLMEIRATDLSFSQSEAGEFFNQSMGLQLNEQQVEALETRTEGWIAGLQLAAVSMQGNDDIPGFIASFAGSHRFVTDYLAEEVLQNQPPDVENFLLKTSILERFCSSLCEAVLGPSDKPTVSGQQMLERLENANIFLIPLDNERKWYRYHHLFGNLLQQRLRLKFKKGDDRQDEAFDSAYDLHARASLWYEKNGLYPEAVRHAILSQDHERVASLAELRWERMNAGFRTQEWYNWVKNLPDKIIARRPVLCAQYADVLYHRGDLEKSLEMTRIAEKWIQVSKAKPGDSQNNGGQMKVEQEEKFKRLPGRLAICYANIVHAQGNIPETEKYVKQALELLPPDDHHSRQWAAGILSMSYWTQGDLESAASTLADIRNKALASGNVLFSVGFYLGWAEIKIAQGYIREAARAYESIIRKEDEYQLNRLNLAGHLYLSLGMIYHEQGNAQFRDRYLAKSEEISQTAAFTSWPGSWRLAQAKIRQSQGNREDWEAALELLDEAKRLYVRDALPDRRPMEALKAVIHIKLGRLDKAFDWINKNRLGVNDPLGYLHEFEHLTLARALIARYKAQGENRNEKDINSALALLERLLIAAEEGKRLGSEIEISIQQALAFQAADNISKANNALERALALAEPEGFVRVFLDEGEVMLRLLNGDFFAKNGYAKRIISLRKKEKRPAAPPVSPEEAPLVEIANRNLIEPLSERELQILRLIAGGLSNRDISERLSLALSTVKSHNQNIFGKLGVERRTEAVARAREKNLI